MALVKADGTCFLSAIPPPESYPIFDIESTFNSAKEKFHSPFDRTNLDALKCEIHHEEMMAAFLRHGFIIVKLTKEENLVQESAELYRTCIETIPFKSDEAPPFYVPCIKQKTTETTTPKDDGDHEEEEDIFHSKKVVSSSLSNEELGKLLLGFREVYVPENEHTAPSNAEEKTHSSTPLIFESTEKTPITLDGYRFLRQKEALYYRRKLPFGKGTGVGIGRDSFQTAFPYIENPLLSFLSFDLINTMNVQLYNRTDMCKTIPSTHHFCIGDIGSTIFRSYSISHVKKDQNLCVLPSGSLTIVPSEYIANPYRNRARKFVTPGGLRHIGVEYFSTWGSFTFVPKSHYPSYQLRCYDASSRSQCDYFVKQGSRIGVRGLVTIKQKNIGCFDPSDPHNDTLYAIPIPPGHAVIFADSLFRSQLTSNVGFDCRKTDIELGLRFGYSLPVEESITDDEIRMRTKVVTEFVIPSNIYPSGPSPDIQISESGALNMNTIAFSARLLPDIGKRLNDKTLIPYDRFWPVQEGRKTFEFTQFGKIVMLLEKFSSFPDDFFRTRNGWALKPTITYHGDSIAVKDPLFISQFVSTELENEDFFGHMDMESTTQVAHILQKDPCIRAWKEEEIEMEIEYGDMDYQIGTIYNALSQQDIDAFFDTLLEENIIDDMEQSNKRKYDGLPEVFQPAFKRPRTNGCEILNFDDEPHIFCESPLLSMHDFKKDYDVMPLPSWIPFLDDSEE